MHAHLRPLIDGAVHAASLAWALLRELGDERPYARYLAAHGRPHSAAAWREFSDQRLRAKYTKPKCC